jgi:hypothetical protein
MTPPPRGELLSLVEQNDGRIFAEFVLLHIIVWTALPVVFTHALPVDVIEGVIWSQGWQLSYIHPPFQAWLLGAANWLTEYQRWAIYLLSQLLVAIGFWAIWRLARLMTSPLGALVSVLTLEGVLFFNFMTPNLFPDLIELPFWALATGSFYRALRFRHLHDWVLLGLWLAAAAYAKYVGAVLAAVMIGFMLIEPQARRCWRTPGPYVSVGLCLVLLAPHLWWVSRHGFPTVHRFSYSAEPTNGFGERLVAVAGFAGGELALVALAGLLVVLLGLRHGEKRVLLVRAPTAFDRSFVATLALGPLFVTLVAATASGLVFRVHWGYAMWSLIGLFAVIFLVPTVDEVCLRRFARAWAGTFLCVALLYAGANTLAPYAHGNFGWHLLDRFHKEAAFPSRELAEQITRRWQEKVGEPLAFVVGSKWVAGHVSFFSADHPLVLRDGSPGESPWIDMDELRRCGAVIIWDPDKDFKTGGRYPGWLADTGPQEQFPTMEIQPPIILSWSTGAALPPLQVMWGILHPADCRRSQHQRR